MLQRLQRSSRGKMERRIKKEIIVIDIWSSSDEDEDEDEEEDEEEDDGSPPRSIFCLKKSSIADIKLIEEKEDCFILDYDPFESIDISKILTISTPDDDAPDLSVVSERGQVACRDYPHSRHLCVKFPFDKTPHESYCEKCYCYVCDSIAPCKSWRGYETGHCHATEHDCRWKSQRKKPETVIPQD